MERPNDALRTAIEKRRIRRYELANELNVSTTCIYRWLRDADLSEDRQQKLWAAIARLSLR